MSVSHKELKEIADLAYLELSKEEIDAFRESVTAILDLDTQLSTVNTEGIVPLAHPTLENPVQYERDDVVTASDEHTLFQSFAPEVNDNFYLVPKVIHHKEG